MLVVLDASNLSRRAYHGGGGGGVIATARKVRALHPEAELVCAWDAPPYSRAAEWPDYKAHRLADPAAHDHVRGEARQCRMVGLRGVYAPTFEADDLAATLIAAHAGPAAFVTTDADWSQLMDYGARWLAPENGGLTERDAGWLWTRHGVAPAQWPELVALKGDPSDGLPGAKGIGPVRALALLKEHGSLEAAIAAEPSLRAQADRLRLFCRLATLRTDAPAQGC